MARRYVRDNRGRFATTGATARGGRLRTAAGNKRATQTMRGTAGPKGTISKPKGLKPSAIKPQRKRSAATSTLRPGELMNANARPVNTMAKPRKGENPFTDANKVPLSQRRKVALGNVKAAKKWLEAKGIQVTVFSGGQTVNARAPKGGGRVDLNRNSPTWIDPAGYKARERRSGHKSTSSPVHTLWHEMGHARDTVGNVRTKMALTRKETWLTPNLTLDPWQRRVRGQEVAKLARRVSRYATTNPSEFIAETYAGLKTGRRYDHQVMRAYREAKGLSPRPAARRRSRIRRKP